MNKKFETWNIITYFIRQIKNQFQHHVKVIHIDNGNEFLLKDLFSYKGIIHQTTCIKTPNKMKLLKENINIFLMLLDLCSFNPSYPWIFSVMPSYKLLYLLVAFLHSCLIIPPLMKIIWKIVWCFYSQSFWMPLLCQDHHY